MHKVIDTVDKCMLTGCLKVDNSMDRYSRFTILINRISRSIHRIKDDAMCKYGLKSAHVSCLYYLYKEGKPLTARELCDACEEDKAAVSRAIDLLCKEGYVICGGNP